MAETDARLEPRQTDLTARLAAQGAMLDELRAVLPTVTPETARDSVRDAILAANALRRPSLASRKKVFVKLSLRYFPAESPRAVAYFVRFVRAAADDRQSALLSYVMLLWNDALVFALGSEWLPPRLAQLPLTVETTDLVRQLEDMAETDLVVRGWNTETRNHIARHYLGILRDCGYATGSLRKALRRPFISPDVVLFAAQLLLGGGESMGHLLEHPLFRAMGMSVHDVVSALTALREQGRIDFAVQGGVVHLVPLSEAGQ